MLTILALMLASPQVCADVKRQCRACTVSKGEKRCSNIGIACQPSIRVCRHKDGVGSSDRPRVGASRRG